MSKNSKKTISMDGNARIESENASTQRSTVSSKRFKGSDANSSCYARLQESSDMNDCKNQFQSLKKINAKRNNTARKEANRIDCVFEKLTATFDRISQCEIASKDLEKAELVSFLAERKATFEVNPVSMVELFLTTGAKPETFPSLTCNAGKKIPKLNKKIKKERKIESLDSSQIARKLSFSTYCTSERSSVGSPSSPTPMDMYANYDKSQNVFSSRKQVQSPIVYNASMLEVVEQEKDFSEEEDKISFFNFSSESTRSETADELESLDFIFCPSQDEEPRFEIERQVQSGKGLNINCKLETAHSSGVYEEEQWMSGFEMGQAFGNEQEISVMQCCDAETTVLANEFEARSDVFDHLL